MPDRRDPDRVRHAMFKMVIGARVGDCVRYEDAIARVVAGYSPSTITAATPLVCGSSRTTCLSTTAVSNALVCGIRALSVSGIGADVIPVGMVAPTETRKPGGLLQRSQQIIHVA